ncbi:hypothetical protein LX36DRAFT_185677 [Colletotrichum falcatum]|nr:hypothetical protein LX36DRAFT_185677 [Colletotrichum falcatum]
MSHTHTLSHSLSIIHSLTHPHLFSPSFSPFPCQVSQSLSSSPVWMGGVTGGSCQLLWRRPIGASMVESTFPDLDGVGESLESHFRPPAPPAPLPGIDMEGRATFSDASSPTMQFSVFRGGEASISLRLARMNLTASFTIPSRQMAILERVGGGRCSELILLAKQDGSVTESIATAPRSCTPR